MPSRSSGWVGVLLFAVPLFSQVQTPVDPMAKAGRLHWFRLGETREDVMRIMGPPALVAGFGADFISWQYRVGERDDEEFSHYFVFRKSDGKLLSVTRSFETDREMVALFPPSETAIHKFHGEHGTVYPVAVRKLDESRLLLAMGAAKPGAPVRQIVLIRTAELRYFHPWLHL